MNREQIIDLIDRNIGFEDMKKAELALGKHYEINTNRMDAADVRNCLNDGHPVAIQGKLIIGYDMQKAFEASDGEFLNIERPVQAIEIKEALPEKEYFAITGRNEWGGISEFNNIIGCLRLGEIYLPKHSAIFNFLNPTAETKKEKIQSVLNGVQINVYERENYVDNCLHEIGHLFWRTCTRFEEKMQFKELFKHLRTSCIYEYEWERSSEEEVFCTIYKWYMKSVLINKSFYNILEYEESYGLKLLQSVFDRIAKERIIDDIWEMSKEDVIEYLNPPLDKTTGKFIRKSGMLDRIKDIELPESILNRIESVQNGQAFVGLGKACVPVKDNLICFDKLKMIPLEKADGKKTIFLDMDGCVTFFSEHYKNLFNRDVHKDDSFTVTEMCKTEPRFFLTIPVLQRGKELYDRLAKKYNVIFLTTAMDELPYCRVDKVTWLKQNICLEPTVIFSASKGDYANSCHDILIDDMDHNIQAFYENGGTALDFRKMSNDEIMQKIAETLNPQAEIIQIKQQIKEMKVNTEPTEKQIKSENYKKGDIIYKNFRIKIENIPGSIRFGFNDEGKKWVSRMKNYYGYIQGIEGADGDAVDCFISENNLSTNKCYVINQMKSGMFDEIKIVFGAKDFEDARKIYLQNYEKGWERNIMNIVPTNTRKLRDFFKDGNYKEPFVGDK